LTVAVLLPVLLLATPLTLQRGVLSAPLGGDLPAAAREWALSHRDALGLPPGSTLTSANAFGTRFGASFHLQQTIDGIEVYRAKAVVTVDAHARVVLITSSVSSYLTARSTWTWDADAALARAVREVPLPALRSDGTAFGGGKRVYFTVGDEVHAGWLLHVPTVDLRHNWYVAIDATNGEVLWRRDFIARAALDANAYAPSPGGLDAGVGATPTLRVQLTHPDGGALVVPNDGGFLVGTQLSAFNCCLNAGCAPDAGPNRESGMTVVESMGTSVAVTYDAAVCARQQRATNQQGSFIYTPVDPPASQTPLQSDPATSDAFAEVHAFWHLNRAYDRIRALAPPAMPLTLRTRAAWVNVVFSDLEPLYGCAAAQSACTLDTLERVDGAAYVPVEEGIDIPLPGYRSGVDTIMLFQGDKADSAYDATVLWHELGHGVVYSTANLGFDTLVVGLFGANNEDGALHEAFADFTAATQGNDPDLGPYVTARTTGATNPTGARGDSFARTLDNTLACPDVLQGEPHQDSQHVSGALWQARRDHFLGTDQGETFDAAWYAMLVSLTPQTGFADMAAALDLHLDEAFPQVPDAGALMQQIFDARGVTGCSDVVDVTGGVVRPYYGVGNYTQTTLPAGSLIPGPHQLLVRTPEGATAVSVSAALQTDPAAAAPQLKLLTRVGSPIKFVKAGQLVNTATSTLDLVNTTGALSVTAPADMPCDAGASLYLSIANRGATSAVLTDLAVTVTPRPECVPAAHSDGGMTVTDGGPSIDTKPKGCGCHEGGWAFPALALAALLSVRRRRHPSR
jgi:hypothetical protein